MLTPVQDVHQVLKNYWGYTTFRPLQEDIIRSILSGKDTLALLPTGGGKSICFQVPALALDGICIVVTPLIALMKDQVEQLRKRGIKAVAVHAGMHKREVDLALDNCVFGDIKFLYLSPERLQTDIFLERVTRMPVSLLAIDEAHCISQWGYDFRPPYLQIGLLREILPNVPVIALTATATELVKQDIQDKLLFKNGQVFQKSFVRKNLSYSCLETEDKTGRLLEILTKVEGTGIVYVRSRKHTMELAKFLQSKRISAQAYHAGMTFKERSLAQQNWIESKTRIMVATNAFGMGIDKPDVRLVVHMDLPDTLEAYYQEAGRAGRDENYAFATILLGPNDTQKLQEKVEQAHPAPEVLKKIYQALANYFQLAVGSGGFSSFDFFLDDFTANYKLSPLEAHHALKRLEQEGFIQLNEAFYTPSKVLITADHPTLYEYQVKYPQYDALIKMLLRIYGGELYSNFMKISEKILAQNLNTTPAAIKKTLKYLDKTGLLVYEPQHDAPQLIFTTNRYDAVNLPLDKKKIEQFRVQALEKVKAVQGYVINKKRCRTQQLVAYFGEENNELCRICDYCLELRKKEKQEAIQKKIRQQVLEFLKAQPQHPKELSQKFSATEIPMLTNQLRELLDTNVIAYNEKGLLVYQD